MEIYKPLKIVPDSLTERIHKELRMDILTGKIPSGTRLVESTLAEELGVSRTPVREALRRLVQEDLLYAIPRAGYVVQELSEHDILDLFETRTSIELVAGRAAVKNISDEELTLLEENLRKTKEAIDAGTTESMIDLDIEFHNIIYRATRSKHLYRICLTLSDHTLKFRKAAIHVPEIAKRAWEGHLVIYKALQSRDPIRVEETITSHLKVVKKDVLGYLAKLREEAFLFG